MIRALVDRILGGAGRLSGPAILVARARGDVTIEPFDPRQINPASYDLRLGHEVAVYRRSMRKFATDIRGRTIVQYVHEDFQTFFDREGEPSRLDAAHENEILTTTVGPAGIVIEPGIGYLFATKERVGTRRYAPTICGKSSVGRLFVQVHATAGFGDPGFDSRWTLEVTATEPTVLYPGMRIAQVAFETIRGKVDLYRGRYGAGNEGPTPSRSWQQIAEDRGWPREDEEHP